MQFPVGVFERLEFSDSLCERGFAMSQKSLFLLEDVSIVRALEQFGVPQVEVRASRRNHMVFAFIFVFLLIGVAGIAFAQAPAAAPSTASTLNARHWEGTLMESGASLLFTLRYEDKNAIVHISGPGYACTLNGRPLRQPTTPDTGNTFSVTPSGGKCDALLGGSMVLDKPAGMSPQQYRLQTFKRNSQTLHTLVLTETGG
jgi:hypothetical protein